MSTTQVEGTKDVVSGEPLAQTFRVNGKEVTSGKDVKLMPFLREELNLTSVKNGCSEGSCGACMVLVDGKPTRSCLTTTEKVAGKSIVTVEGLSEREKDVYSWAFASAGAVQCGFCMPGMVMTAKGLVDAQPEPASEEIEKALQFSMCRCTGYGRSPFHRSDPVKAGRSARPGRVLPRLRPAARPPPWHGRLR